MSENKPGWRVGATIVGFDGTRLTLVERRRGKWVARYEAGGAAKVGALCVILGTECFALEEES